MFKAKNLFLQGIEHEQSGKLYEAIQFYRRAVQLVPDVEFRLYESTKPKIREKIDADEKALEKTTGDNNRTEDDLNVDENDCDILGKLTKAIQKNGYVCFPVHEQSVSHPTCEDLIFVQFKVIYILLFFRQHTFRLCLWK